MHRIAVVLITAALGTGLAACGDDDEATTTSTATTTEDVRGYPAAGDDPFEVQATVEKINEVEDITVLSVETTEGDTYDVLVPPDVTLDEQTQLVFAEPDCGGKVLANLELVNAPAQEELGDTVLVRASIDTESCLAGG